jgi:hypothetical protein
MSTNTSQVTEYQWVTFPGGELEGRRPKALCSECRECLCHAAATGGAWAPKHQSTHAPKHLSRPLCFQCYRAEIKRERALKSAGELDTASVERFQSALPFEPVNGSRLEMLKVERAASRAVMAEGTVRFAERRHQAQIAARHALDAVAAGWRTRRVAVGERGPLIASAIHAAELQLPESWLPFVVSR